MPNYNKTSRGSNEMKGIVFNLLEEVVIRHYGENTWDALLDDTGLTGAYTSLGSYPDDDIYKLVGVASKALNLSTFDLLRWFGREAMPLMATRYPAYFQGHAAAREFVLSVNSIIHPEVRKVYPGADVPTFGFRDEPGGALLMEYRSARRLCALAQGFVEGAGDQFGESVEFEHLKCMHNGDASCLCRITFAASRRD
ncbi:heme NO-binding domain-containing protein [Cupriavidus sp. TMH.W2]|uniref:heme NO-binding domain-containing protein n=1 Tax=Cupriavidus sp. TMH.W2 TaxID=3434465 RepID=UPI003D770CDA